MPWHDWLSLLAFHPGHSPLEVLVAMPWRTWLPWLVVLALLCLNLALLGHTQRQAQELGQLVRRVLLVEQTIFGPPPPLAGVLRGEYGRIPVSHGTR